jgi:Fe-S oxidoreductase
VATLGRDEPCCGSVQKRIGDAALAHAMIDDNIALFNSLGCETIVTLCAGCTSMLTNEYRRAEVPLKPAVVPLVAYLPRLLQSGALELRRRDAGAPPRTVAYHDPCHLGRHLGVYDPPREVLRRLPGVALVERAATRENTICCGAGGGMRLFDGGALAEKIGGMAVQEAARAGANALVTACPFCELNLAAAAQAHTPDLVVCDIIDLVYDSLA